MTTLARMCLCRLMVYNWLLEHLTEIMVIFFKLVLYIFTVVNLGLMNLTRSRGLTVMA